MYVSLSNQAFAGTGRVEPATSAHIEDATTQRTFRLLPSYFSDVVAEAKLNFFDRFVGLHKPKPALGRAHPVLVECRNSNYGYQLKDEFQSNDIVSVCNSEEASRMSTLCVEIRSKVSGTDCVNLWREDYFRAELAGRVGCVKDRDPSDNTLFCLLLDPLTMLSKTHWISAHMIEFLVDSFLLSLAFSACCCVCFYFLRPLRTFSA
jgi:hypothetical protein